MADDDLEPVDDPEVDAEANGAPAVLTSRKASGEEPYRKGEMALVERVEGFYADAEQAKKDLCEPDTWPDSLDVYWGDQWPSGLPSYKPRIMVNEIKSDRKSTRLNSS